MKTRFIGVAVLAAALIIVGCVSTSTFEKMQAEKNDEISVLKKNNGSLEQQKAALEQEKKSVQGKVVSLEQDKASLEQEKAALAASKQQSQQQYEALTKQLSAEVEKGQIQVRQYKNLLSVDLAEQIFFDSGRASLKPEGKDILKKVGEALKGYDNKIIRVVGHTDNVGLAKSLQALFPSNWELSVARASNVVRFLQQSGVPPERMIAAGRGEYDPIAPNDTPEGRKKNRRIEIMLLDKSLASELSRPAI